MDNGCVKFGLSSPRIHTINEAAIMHEAILAETRETGLDASVNFRRPRRSFLKRWKSSSSLPSRRPEVGLDESVTSRKPFVTASSSARMRGLTPEVGLDESVTSRKSFRRNRSSAGVNGWTPVTSLSTSSASPSSLREVGLDESVTSRESFRRRSASRRVPIKVGKLAFDVPSVPMPAAVAPKTNLARMA